MFDRRDFIGYRETVCGDGGVRSLQKIARKNLRRLHRVKVFPRYATGDEMILVRALERIRHRLGEGRGAMFARHREDALDLLGRYQGIVNGDVFRLPLHRSQSRPH